MTDANDLIEITKLYGLYNSAIDSGDAFSWASTFTATGAFYHPRRIYTGSAELHEFVTTRTDGLATSPYASQRHWNDALTAVVKGDEAFCTCDLLLSGIDRETGRPAAIALGRYKDHLLKTTDGWRFQSRELTVL